MDVVRRVWRGSVAVLLGAACLSLAGCSQGAPIPAAGPDSTALPAPSIRPVPVGPILERRVREMLGAKAVQVDEDLQTGRQEVEVRLTWGAHGSVVDASSLPIGPSTPPGSEVFRSPHVLLQRPVGRADSCWSPGRDAAARFDRPVAQEIAVLRSARATSGDSTLLKGTLSARALLGLLGSDAGLRDRGLIAPANARVPATFGTSGGELDITTGWTHLLTSTGSPKGASGTWLLRFRRFGSTGPSAPTADMMCP